MNAADKKQSLPQSITSYDLLKTFAVIIMVVDHMGLYFFPEDLWWRAVGRIGFPVWFFLLGYARGRDIPPKLWGGAVVLTIGSLLAGMSLFPFNALVTIILIRVSLDPIMKRSLQSQSVLWGMSLIFMCLVPISYFGAEYGTQALITAIFGYLVRNREEIGNEALVINYMGFALVTFIAFQQLFFDFSTAQFLFMAVGTMIVRIVLYYFESQTYPNLTAKLGFAITWFVQFCGRKTLEIYIVHLLLFKLIAVLIFPEDYPFLMPQIFP